MVRDIKFSMALLVAMVCISTTLALGQQPSPKQTYKHDGKIEVKFDESKNQTVVRLDTMKIYENDSETLSMIVSGSYAGKTPPAPPSELLFVLYASSKQRRYQTEPQLIVTADSEVVRTRQLKNYGARTEGDRVIEPLLTMMPYDILAKMANAKKVTLKIGTTEYEMTANNLEALRDFASRMVP
jgi:hypothetical protein